MPLTEPSNLESEIVAFLAELSSAQTEMLELLVEKREFLVKYDGDGLASIVPREERLEARLQACLDRRAELLVLAEQQGLSHTSIRELAGSLAGGQRSPLAKSVQQASSQARILQHNSVTNWVLVQRTLIHLSQMLEIIATGGRPQPTYGKGDAPPSSGALVDQAA